MLSPYLTKPTNSSPEQHWGLMPMHAVCSTVIPTYLMYGMGMGYGAPNPTSFPQCVSFYPHLREKEHF